jgi:hypothetical protein
MENNIKMDLRGIGWKDVELAHLVQVGLMNIPMNLQVQ